MDDEYKLNGLCIRLKLACVLPRCSSLIGSSISLTCYCGRLFYFGFTYVGLDINYDMLVFLSFVYRVGLLLETVFLREEWSCSMRGCGVLPCFGVGVGRDG